MKRLLAFLITVSLFSLLLPVSTACFWDYDTIETERLRFPETLELITGKFLRHSEEFYRWRIQDRLRRIDAKPNDVRLYDDLAVSYEKTGNHEKAIEAILLKDSKRPGLYETHANLGTFYIHAGDLEKGLAEIQKAIEINPQAHFGREIYQKKLVEYVMIKKKDGELKLPLDPADSRNSSESSARGFAAFLDPKASSNRLSRRAQRKREQFVKKATTGVLGMMRFGNYDSPVLLEALGDLLLFDPGNDAGNLAARAYLKASYEVESKLSKAAYRQLALMAAQGHLYQDGKSKKPLTLKELEPEFKKELEDAERWYSNVERDELEFIKKGGDVDKLFAEKYFQAPVVQTK